VQAEHDALIVSARCEASTFARRPRLVSLTSELAHPSDGRFDVWYAEVEDDVGVGVFVVQSAADATGLGPGVFALRRLEGPAEEFPIERLGPPGIRDADLEVRRLTRHRVQSIARKLGRMKVAALPLREELDALARHYHHLQIEHQNASPGSSARRHLEDKLLRVRERIDRVLEEWVPEEELRESWRRYLQHHGPEPDGPPAIEPVVFRGRSEVTGSILEIRGSEDELRVEVDGALIERIEADKDFASTAPVVPYRVNENEFVEIFQASDEALQALSDFLERGESPPWEHASELLEDGLVDVHFAFTPRGHRALARA
jgi:hypothetical protein